MRQTLLLIFLFSLIIISSAQALDFGEVQDEIDTASSDVEEFFEGIPQSDMVIVRGSKVSFEDKVLFNLIKGSVSSIQSIEAVPDTKLDIDATGKSAFILLGTTKTNSIAQDIIDSMVLDKKTALPVLRASYYHSDDGKKAIIIYSKKEEANLEDRRAQRSILSGIIDERYIPAVSTILTLLLLYLWSIFGSTFMDFLNEAICSLVLDKAHKKKCVSDKKKMIHEIKAHEFINIHEILAFIITVALFAFSMSWGFYDNNTGFWRLFFIDLLVVGVVLFVREIIRLAFCYRHKIRSEYVLWPFGAFMTLITTFLGNSFSLTSYTLHDDKGVDEKRFGKAAYLISMLTMIAGFGFYILNIAFPSIIFQMAFIYCIMLSFIEFSPIKPMPGVDMKNWRRGVWIISYILIIGAYFLANFSIFG